VAVDLDEDLPHIVTARRRGVPVIIGDMTLPETLAEANVAKACCVVLCTGNDLANIEAAITVKELNPDAIVYARVFKKSLADKINAALRYDIRTFSPYATAAESILSQINGG
jgi:voltage-gated potassium channel Kch